MLRNSLASRFTETEGVRWPVKGDLTGVALTVGFGFRAGVDGVDLGLDGPSSSSFMKATWAAKSNGRNSSSGEVSRFNGVLELRARPRCSSRTFVLLGDFRTSDAELLISQRPSNTLKSGGIMG